MAEPERVLFVHAHPDDESISTGGTIASLVEQGAAVVVLTCTRGERGEIILPELAATANSPQAVGELRERELALAMAALAVTDHRYLGDDGARWPGRPPRRYLDSGMAWNGGAASALSVLDPQCLTAAEFGDVAADVAAVITEFQPDVVVSYDENGGYGHPDHIRAHQAARRAADVYGVPFYAIEAESAAAVRAGERALTVDVGPVLDRKRAALAAHRSQLVLSGDTFTLSNGVAHAIGRTESFRRVRRGFADGPTPFREQGAAVKLAAAGFAAIAGFAIGGMLTVTHQGTVTLGGIDVPIALLSDLAIVAALLAGLRMLFDSRFVAGFAALGIVVAVGLLTLPGAGGGVLIPGNAVGIVWALGPMLLAAIVLGWPRRRSRAAGRIGASPK